MDVGAVCERMRAVASVRTSTDADRSALEGGLRSIAVVRSWLTAAEADLASRLADVSSFPEQAIAEGAWFARRGETGVERRSTLRVRRWPMP